MGFLTPILIRNDSVDLLRENAQEAMNQIFDACMQREEDYFGVGNHANPIESLGTAHADEWRVIVVKGNSWIDLSRIAFSKDNKLTDYTKSCFDCAAQIVKILRKKIKDGKISL